MLNIHRHLRLILAGCCLGAGASYAWGPEGHEIVGYIAEHHLTPQAVRVIHDLLNAGPTNTNIRISDPRIANWADDLRETHPETAPWHFVDIPFDATAYDADRDCRQHGGCIIEAIERFRNVLADSPTHAAARVEALKFLVHFVGDIHMPLHCINRHDDMGGNMVWVRVPGDEKATRLHAFWDENLVVKSLHDRQLTPATYADWLNRAITSEQRKLWNAGTPTEWAWESHQLAIKQVYAGIPEHSKAHLLDTAYITSGQRLVAEQLSKAGIRLAYLLNEICTPNKI